VNELTRMPAEEFDALASSLDVPDSAPGIEHLARNGRRYRQADTDSSEFPRWFGKSDEDQSESER